MLRSSPLCGASLGAIYCLAFRPLVAQQPADTTSAARPHRRAPLAARDSLTSGTTVIGDVLARQPVDDVRQLLGLAPGVVFRGSSAGLPTAADFFVRCMPLRYGSGDVDGAPARSEPSGTQA